MPRRLLAPTAMLLVLGGLAFHGARASHPPSPPAERSARTVGVPPRTLTAKITAYCQAGVTRAQTWTRPGVVATDWRVFPQGTQLAIDGWPGVYVSEDTGGEVRGRHIDVWTDSCQDAVYWGVQYREVTLVQGATRQGAGRIGPAIPSVVRPL